MKTHWLRTLRNSIFGFLCTTLVAAPWAAAQAPATQPGQTLDDLVTVLGVEKSQIDETTAQGDAAVKAVKEVRKELGEAIATFQRRDLQTALGDLEAAFKADPSLPPPSVMMARLCFASNDQNVVNLGRRYLEQAVTTHKKYPEAYLLLGRLALTEGRLTDADLNFQRAMDYAPKEAGEGEPLGETTGWTPERRIAFLKEIYAGMVSVSEQRPQWDEAEHQLNAWLALDKDDAMAEFRKGRVLFLRTAQKAGTEKKNYDDARAALKSAYELALKDKDKKEGEVTAVPPPELAMLQLLSGVGNVEEAEKEVKELEKIAESYPEDKEKSRVLSALSQWHLQRNNPKLAGEMAVKAQGFDKDSPALAQLSAVMRYYANDQKAQDDFETMNRAAPDDFVASNFLALLLCESARKEDKDKAVRLAELNVRLNPKSPEAVSTLGWVYHRAGRPSEAMQVYGALLQAVQQGQGQINADTAYYMAKVIAESPAQQGKMDAVMDLLKRATSSQGPFKNRAIAQIWYDQLLGKTGGGVSPGGSSIPTNPDRVTPTPAGGTPTPPAVTPPTTPKAPGTDN